MQEDYRLCPHCHNAIDKKNKQCPYCLNFVDINNYTDTNSTNENNINNNNIFKARYINNKPSLLHKFFELLPWIISTKNNGDILPLSQEYWDDKNKQGMPNKYDENLVKKAKIIGVIFYLGIIGISILLAILSSIPNLE